jgi:hypothetical protein
LGEFLGVLRHTVRRFRKAEIIDIEVDKILSDISNLQLKPYQLTLQGFIQLPIIQRFHDLNVRLEISKKRIRTKIRSLLNICRHLNVHPRKLKPEQCAELLIKVKNLPIARARRQRQMPRHIQVWARNPYPRARCEFPIKH